jgi:NAD(P)-dependent dehydrogenase (short-subunit alcohol dehydrogenase family)
LLDEYSDEKVLHAMGELRKRALLLMRAHIGNLPDGLYSFEDVLDNDGIKDEFLTIALDMTIKGDQMTLDFSRTSPQCAGPVNISRATAVAAELKGSIGLAVDVASEEGVRDAVATVHREMGRIDCVFNAAGHADFGPIETWTLERWNRMMGVHVGGTFLVCKYVLPIMRSQGGGSIVNVASIAAMVAQPNNSPYGAAKGAIVGFSRQLALEAAPVVRVNVVAPGRIRTGMTVPLWQQRGGGNLEAGVSQAAVLNLLKRVGEPDDIAGPVCFLFSDDAAFMTGTILVPDGGETAV